LELVPGAFKEAETFLSNDLNTRARFSRVEDLVSGFETPFGLELLATVHWVATRERANMQEDAILKVHAWNERKKRFSSRQIGVALDVLQKKDWLEAV
jgi:hypothetical protein